MFGNPCVQKLKPPPNSGMTRANYDDVIFFRIYKH